MPVTCAVTTLTRSDLGTVGDYVNAVNSGSCEPVDILVALVGADGQLVPDAALDAAIGVEAGEVVAAYQLKGTAGQVAQVIAKAGEGSARVVFLGVGDRSPAALRRAGGELGRLLRPGEVAAAPGSVGLSGSVGPDGESLQAFAEGILLGSYRYTEKSSSQRSSTGPGSDPDSGQPTEVRLLAPPEGFATSVQTATAVAAAVALTRDLSNTPSVRKYPQWLADCAVKVAAESGLEVRVWTESELASAGFGGILAVGSGSDRPPRLIELRYEPPGATRHVVLVGKGITFDSGGLSLKPNDGMKAMKTDMAGGAAVIAAMSALRGLGVTVRVTGLIAAAENMPSGSAYRPGDVITQYGGKTVEVLNTDAEGRIVLGDALAYADAELAPDAMVDLATLTGAARIALGGSHAALYTSSDELAAALLAAGLASGDRLWRMPLVDDYASVLDSPVADLSNVARRDGQAGSIAAALFLREFAGSRPWAHLDIAGAARSGADDGETSAGATGFGTRLLLRWLSSS